MRSSRVYPKDIWCSGKVYFLPNFLFYLYNKKLSTIFYFRKIFKSWIDLSKFIEQLNTLKIIFQVIKKIKIIGTIENNSNFCYNLLSLSPQTSYKQSSIAAPNKIEP